MQKKINIRKCRFEYSPKSTPVVKYKNSKFFNFNWFWINKFSAEYKMGFGKLIDWIIENYNVMCIEHDRFYCFYFYDKEKKKQAHFIRIMKNGNVLNVKKKKGIDDPWLYVLACKIGWIREPAKWKTYNIIKRGKAIQIRARKHMETNKKAHEFRDAYSNKVRIPINHIKEYDAYRRVSKTVMRYRNLTQFKKNKEALAKCLKRKFRSRAFLYNWVKREVESLK